MKNKLITTLAIMAMILASCTSCRVTRDLQRSNTDSTAYYREKAMKYKDSLTWTDSVHTELVKNWLEMGVVFAEEPCPTGRDTTIPIQSIWRYTNENPSGYITWPLTRIETKPDGSTVFQTNQRLKALNLKLMIEKSRTDSVSKASQVKDSVIKDLEQKVELVKKEKIVHVEKEWYIPWWIWLIVAGLAFLWVRKQFF